jgi:hypothetical protein
MSDDFGLLNLVVSPFLERVAKDVRLGNDQPRKQRNLKSRVVLKTEDSTAPDIKEEADDSMSSNHIDLRI